MQEILTDGNEPALSIPLTPPHQGSNHASVSQDYVFTVRVKTAPAHPLDISVIVRGFDPTVNTFVLGDTSPVTGVDTVAVGITQNSVDKRIITFKITFNSDAAGKKYFFYGYNKQSAKQVGGGVTLIEFA